MAELYRRNNPNRAPQSQGSYVDNDGDVMMCNTGGSSKYTKKSYNNQQSSSHGKTSPMQQINYSLGSGRKKGDSYSNKNKYSSVSLLSTIALLCSSVVIYGGLRFRYSFLNRRYDSTVETQKKSYQDQHTKRIENSRERTETRKLEQETTTKENGIKELAQSLSNMKTNINFYVEENVKVADALGKTSGVKVSELTGEKYDEERMKKREDAWYHRIDILQKRIQRESQRQLLELFGPDQMRVELQLETKKQKGSIVLEMAPTNIMPHSVHLFLFQVMHKLWDGTSFAINAAHILQAGAYSPDGMSVRKKFKDSGLEVVAFQEYSDKFTHLKWNVGFAGRPGGPDIYINKMNNAENHGPGGQTHHHLEEEADPAFAKVVKGKEFMEDLFKMEVEGKNFLLKEYITIAQARVIYPDEEPHEYDYKDYYDGYAEDDMYHLDESYHEEYDSHDSSDDSHEHTEHIAQRVRPHEKKINVPISNEKEQTNTQAGDRPEPVKYRATRQTTHHLDEMLPEGHEGY